MNKHSVSKKEMYLLFSFISEVSWSFQNDSRTISTAFGDEQKIR